MNSVSKGRRDHKTNEMSHIPFGSEDGIPGATSSETTAAVDRLNSPLVVVADETVTLLVGSDFSSSGRLETDT
jgi:hypothetical protein